MRNNRVNENKTDSERRLNLFFEILKQVEILVLLGMLIFSIIQFREYHLVERMNAYTDIASKITSDYRGIHMASAWLGFINDDTTLRKGDKELLKKLISEKTSDILLYRIKTLNTKTCSNSKGANNGSIDEDCKLLAYVHELAGNKESRTDFTVPLQTKLFQEKYYLTGLWNITPIKNASDYCKYEKIVGPLFIFRSPDTPEMDDAWVLVLGESDTLIDTVLLKSKLSQKFPTAFTSYEQTSWNEPGLKIQTDNAFANWTKTTIDCNQANPKKARPVVL